MPAAAYSGALKKRMQKALPKWKDVARQQYVEGGGQLAKAPGGPRMGRPGGGGGPVSAAVMPQTRKGSLDIAEGASGFGEGRGVGGRRHGAPEGTAVQPGTTPAVPEVATAEVATPGNVARPTPGTEGPIEPLATPQKGPAVPRGVQDAGAGAGGQPITMERPGLRQRLARQAAGPGPGGFGMITPAATGGTQAPGGRPQIQQYMAQRGAMPAFQMAQRPRKRRSRFFTGAGGGGFR